MNDETQVIDTGIETQEQAPQVESSPAPEVVETQTEKMIPQSQLEKIVKLAKRDSERSGYEKARNEYAGYQAPQEQQAPSMGGMIQMTPEQLEQRILETANKVATRQMADTIEKDFYRSVDEAKDADPEFAIKYDKLNIEQHPELILWTHGMENRTKVLGDLAENPTKFANILMLAKSGLGELAKDELRKISSSMKANQEALKQPVANEPLDHLKPSSIGTDNGSMTVSDFKSQSWLRG
jgi:hypothetical protein